MAKLESLTKNQISSPNFQYIKRQCIVKSPNKNKTKKIIPKGKCAVFYSQRNREEIPCKWRGSNCTAVEVLRLSCVWSQPVRDPED